jgi:hypothetical protein
MRRTEAVRVTSRLLRVNPATVRGFLASRRLAELYQGRPEDEPRKLRSGTQLCCSISK